MEKKQSLLDTVAKGFFYTAISGALMGGIFMGVTAIAGTLGFGAGIGLAAAAGAVTVTALSTGIFGAVLQGYNFIHGKKEAQEIGSTPMNARDISITAVSANLPHLKGVMLEKNTPEQQPEQSSPTVGSTHFQDKVGARSSINERANALLARLHEKPSHSERITQERAQAAVEPTRTLH